MRVEEALEISCMTDPGMVRSHNEDSVASEPAYGLVVLADGMGGYNAGEVASGITVSVITTEVTGVLQKAGLEQMDRRSADEVAVKLLRENIQRANASIYYAAQGQSQYTGMGTTVVAGLFYDNRVAVAHVGDSRMYRLRGERMEAITRDHSWLQEQIDSGLISREAAHLSKNRNLVTRAVGIDAKVESEIRIHDVQIGDVYLLCSDGLNDMVNDEDIQSVLYAMQGNLPLAVTHLVQMANDNGGRDNISVILVRIKGRFDACTSWLTKVLGWFGK
jgi:protein phosphatase